MINEKWTWHTEGRRAFVLDVDGYVVCEIIAPTINNDGTRAAEIAQRIVSDHNRVLGDPEMRVQAGLTSSTQGEMP